MAVHFNHTIVKASDKAVSARFWGEVLGLGQAVVHGPFLSLETANGVSLDFADTEGEPSPIHYCFLVSEDEFDAIHARIERRELEHWADPFQKRPGEINHNDGGRGVYWCDPDGHFLEAITRPYSWG